MRSLVFDVAFEARNLRHTRTHIVGLGLSGHPPAELQGRLWYYIPDPAWPCYRVTCLSNLSPATAPENSWSLMAEVAESSWVPLHNRDVVQSCIDALRALRLLPSDVSILAAGIMCWKQGYPIPTRNRDSILNEVLPALRDMGNDSRGWFAAWKYEVSNQDHSRCRESKPWEHLTDGHQEITLEQPGLVNSRRNPFPCPEWIWRDDERFRNPLPHSDRISQ